MASLAGKEELQAKMNASMRFGTVVMEDLEMCINSSCLALLGPPGCVS